MMVEDFSQQKDEKYLMLAFQRALQKMTFFMKLDGTSRQRNRIN